MSREQEEQQSGEKLRPEKELALQKPPAKELWVPWDPAETASLQGPQKAGGPSVTWLAAGIWPELRQSAVLKASPWLQRHQLWPGSEEDRQEGLAGSHPPAKLSGRFLCLGSGFVSGLPSLGFPSRVAASCWGPGMLQAKPAKGEVVPLSLRESRPIVTPASSGQALSQSDLMKAGSKGSYRRLGRMSFWRGNRGPQR